MNDPLLIYISRSGDIEVVDIDNAQKHEEDPDYEHVATIDPRSWIENLLIKNPDFIKDFR